MKNWIFSGLFVFAVVGCASGVSLSTGNMEMKAKMEACNSSCDEAKKQCIDKCAEEVDKDTCTQACDAARDACADKCKDEVK